MEIILLIILCIVIYVCLYYLIKRYKDSIEEKEAQKKHLLQVQDSKNELSTLYNELYGELESQYNNYLKQPEYEKTKYPTVTVKGVPLWNEKWLRQSFDIWRNDENLCWITNFDSIKREAEYALDSVSENFCDENMLVRKDNLRKWFANDPF